MATEVKAIAKYVRTSPQKVRRILDQIRGKSYKEAVMLLSVMPYKACSIILKIVDSAAANAQVTKGFNKNKLIISKTFVDKGPTLKRFRPRAQGRGYKILKPTCHITVQVQDQSL
uniref:Large ribosomal subunit protein uL22c n=1 Tax=Cyanophora paradoxa TaxID=2762 RepID=RK22_CYAPA|nr:ribosomal protein L22 [Cyanophora paradoxa]P15768.3 RecName: Full=Large ribosomal subunit protein uL22c; AltName: Full=50S ribosomal protein L22, cyanelle [Cyanophora paradoxa]AAA81228.1 ribosomal protein L22 [Cyanophora paradoxa]